VFKGSDDIRDWVSNLNVTPESEHYEFHSGFHLAALKFVNKVRSIISENKGKSISLIGYSRGGAIAAILAYLILKKSDKLKIELTTFGQPRCFEEEKVKDVQYMILTDQLKYKRIFFQNDIVSRLPLRLQNFQHVGDKLVLKAKWWHYLPFLTVKIKVHTYYERYFW
jgi:poly(3-hydroxyalkanoate) synthetase